MALSLSLIYLLIVWSWYFLLAPVVVFCFNKDIFLAHTTQLCVALLDPGNFTCVFLLSNPRSNYGRQQWVKNLLMLILITFA